MAENSLEKARERFTELETGTTSYRSSINFVFEEIEKNLAVAGLDFAALDVTGASSAAEMEVRFQKAKARHYLMAAQNEFKEFENTDISYSTGTIDFKDRQIRDLIKKADADMAALDISGQSSADEMEERLQKAKQNAHLVAARFEFRALKTARAPFVQSAEFYVDTIKKHLGKALKTFSALDPEGKKTDAEMEQELEAATKRFRLKKLTWEIEKFAFPESGSYISFAKKDSSDYFGGKNFPSAKAFSTNFSEKNSASFLKDPSSFENRSGRFSSNLRLLVPGPVNINAFLVRARDLFAKLELGELAEDFDFLEKRMYGYLRLSDHDVSALDESGVSSITDIEARIKNAKEKFYISKARFTFEILETLKTDMPSEEVVGLKNIIIVSLEKAGVDASALDKNGKISAADMQVRIEKAKNRAHVFNAIKKFKLLEDYVAADYYPLEEMNTLITILKKHLAESGDTFSVLDSSGIRSEKEIENYLDRIEKKAYLKDARDKFENFEKRARVANLLEISLLVIEIDLSLDRAGVTRLALDSKGESSLAQIEERLEKGRERLRETYRKDNTKPEKKNVPIAVFAPIVIDASGEDSQLLLDFVESLENNSNVAIAEAESQRLASYFGFMSVHLSAALENNSLEDMQPSKEKLQKLTTPGSLSGIFNAAAKHTHNTLISDVAILPLDIKSKGPASYLFENQKQFDMKYDYHGRGFNFGFLQVFEAGPRHMANFSTTFPTFMLDSDMLKNVRPYAPKSMLSNFQKMMTIVNHDMLHHMNTPSINTSVAANFNDAHNRWSPISLWMDGLPKSENFFNGALYEEWSQVTHESTLLHPNNNAALVEIENVVDQYFDDLNRICNDFCEADENKQKIHETIDYFGMMMSHALTRILPLDHPLLSHALDRLQAADPGSGEAEGDFVNSNKQPIVQSIQKNDEENAWSLAMKYSQAAHDESKVIKDYKAHGFVIVPDNSEAFGYKNIKLLELVKMAGADAKAHAPAAAHTGMGKVRNNVGRSLLDMVAAAAKSFDYQV